MVTVRVESVFDTVISDNLATEIFRDFKAAVRSRLQAVGIEPVFEDAFGVFALSVVDAQHVGTAYLELRDDNAALRILLVDEVSSNGRVAAC